MYYTLRNFRKFCCMQTVETSSNCFIQLCTPWRWVCEDRNMWGLVWYNIIVIWIKLSTSVSLNCNNYLKPLYVHEYAYMFGFSFLKENNKIALHSMSEKSGSLLFCVRYEGHPEINPLNAELNPICYLLALLAHHFLHVSRIRVKSLTFRLLMS